MPESRAGVQPRRIGPVRTLPTVLVSPMTNSRELVRANGLPQPALIVVGNDHRLADPEPLAALRRACEAAVS